MSEPLATVCIPEALIVDSRDPRPASSACMLRAPGFGLLRDRVQELLPYLPRPAFRLATTTTAYASLSSFPDFIHVCIFQFFRVRRSYSSGTFRAH